jgi:colanic acid biosynthesis glycosyl transferase WcaI
LIRPKGSDSLKILISSILFSPEPISTGKFTGEMAEWLSDQGHEVRVITTPPHYPQWRVYPGFGAWKFSRETRQSGSREPLEIFRCPVWIPTNPRGWRRIAYLASFSLTSCLAFIRQLPWAPDLVLLVEPTLFCAPHTLVFGLLTSSVSWLHVQDFEVDVAFRLNDLPGGGIRDWAARIERLLLRRFDKVSTISNRMLERLSVKGLPQEKCAFLPNWVDVSQIYPSDCGKTYRAELGISPDSVVALYSGNMGLKQGLGLLADACSRVANRSDIKFVFCGDGPYRSALANQIRGLRNAIMIPLQPADRLNDLLNLADIHLLPQVAGAEDLVMPSKLAAIFASGRPVIATASEGSELSTAVESRGLIIPPNDPNAFAAAIVRLADDPSARGRMGARARAYAVEQLNKDAILKRIERIMLQACGQVDSKHLADGRNRPDTIGETRATSATVSPEK